LLQIALTRTLGVAEYGTYTYAVAYAFLLAIPGAFGFRTVVVRLLPSFCIQDDYERARGLVRFALFVCAFVSISISAVGMLIVYLSEPQSADTLKLAMFLIPFLALSHLYLGLLRGVKKMFLALAPSQIIRPLLLMILVFIVSYSFSEFTSSVAIVLMILATAMALLFQVVSFKKSSAVWPATTGVKVEAKNWLKIAAALFIADSFYEVLNRIDIIMLGAMYDETASGIYNVAARTAAMVSIVITAVNSAAASKISEIYTTEGASEQLQALITKIARWVFWLSVLSAVFLLVFGKPVLSLFGAEFVLAYEVLIICVVGQVINTFAGPVGMLLNMTGNHKQVAKIYGWSAVINVLLNAVLIPEYGILGAAYATIATTFIWNVWMAVMAKIKVGVNTTIIHYSSS